MKRYFTKNIILLFNACFFLYVSQGVAQTNFYVATTGNNGNAGTDVSAPKQTIMAAYYAASAGDIINVEAGTYIETDAIWLNKSITIKGSNAGLAATAWTNSETIIRPKATNFADGSGDAAVVQMVTGNITLDGIAIYGDNLALSGATVINGVGSNVNYGVMAYNNLSGLKVLNCKFANFVSRGVSWAIYDSNTVASGGNEIKNCTFDNIVKASGGNGAAIYLSNFVAEVSGNTVTRADRGLFYETNASVAHTSPLLSISGNIISAYDRGILLYGGGNAIIPATEIKSNTLTWQDISTRSGDGVIPTSNNDSRGIAIDRARGTATILVQNNNVTGYNDGISALSVERNPSNLNRLTIEGGTITNSTNTGILVSNYVNLWESRAAIKGVNVVNAANSGIFVTSSGNSYNTEAALSNGVVLQKDLPITSNYNQAIYVNGSKAILTELGNTKITNAKFNFINLDNNAMSGLEVDGTAMTFNGIVEGYTFVNYTPGLSNNMAIANALQERIRDNNPLSFGRSVNAGLIKFNFNVLPVTLTSFTAKAGTNGTQLNWITSSEKNNAYFVIARSFDGANFTDLTKIQGNGTSDTEKTYTYTDKNFKQNAYYLLKQVDLNGEVTSYTKLVRFVKGLGNNLSVYPNPVVDVLSIDLTLPADVAIYNISGKRVISLAKQPVGKLSVNAGALPIGSYTVVISDAEGKKHEKFIKK